MKTFVYTELQINQPFDDFLWKEINNTLKHQPGLHDKTWLAGIGNTIGGFYCFNTREDAARFVNNDFPQKAKDLGVAQTSRLFDGDIVADASIDMYSVHFGIPNTQAPGAFVYTEVQISAPFEPDIWQPMNPILKQQAGLLSKTWLSGLGNQSLGGLYSFDNIQNANKFVTEYFPKEAAQLGAAFTTKLFDSAPTQLANIDMQSPYYSG